MPIYEYDCPECGRFEVMQKISDKPLGKCPKCLDAGKKNRVKRVVSRTSFRLKGSGWYQTDYGSGSSNGSSGTVSNDSQKGASSKSATKESSSASSESNSGNSGSGSEKKDKTASDAKSSSAKSSGGCECK